MIYAKPRPPTGSIDDMNTPFPILPIRKSNEGNSLQYAVYPIYPDVNLKNVLEYTLDLMSTWTHNYIWNLQPFTLQLDSTTPKLYGAMDMGDDSGAPLDEWIVVGVFWHISERFPNVAIRYRLDLRF